MSLDLTDPDVVATRKAILSKDDPTTWFLLTYSAPPSTLRVVASGANPALPAIREQLAHTSEDVVFGYAEVYGKGLVIACMRDNVGGVRRARAVVHSRTVASLFPDYAALITVAHHSHLTDEQVGEKLGFDPSRGFPPPPSSSSTVHTSSTPDKRYPDHLSRQMPSHLKTSSSASPSAETTPPVPAKDHPLQLSESRTSTSSLHSQMSDRSRASGKERPSTPLRENLDLAGEITPVRRENLHKIVTPSGKPSPLPLAPPVDTSRPFPSTHPHGNPGSRIVSAPVHSHSHDQRGIASSDVFPDRNRKTSLTSRLGQFGSAFGRGSPKAPNSPTSPLPGSPSEKKSPASPSMSRFISSNLVKNFGRRVSGDPTPPVSPQRDNRQSQPPPPLPPKDEEVVAYTPPSELIARESDTTTTTAAASHGHLKAESQEALIRSESAQKALADASQKRVKDESEIQERFRRDEEERNKSRYSNGLGPQAEAEDDSHMEGILDGYSRDSRRDTVGTHETEEDEEFGLPYDRPGPDSPEAERRTSTRPRAVALPSQSSISHPAHPLNLGPLIATGSPLRPSATKVVDTANPCDPNPDHPYSSADSGEAEYNRGVPEDEPDQDLGRELEEDESVTERIMEMELAEEESDAGGEAVEMSVQADEHAIAERARREAEKNRMEHLERERARYADVRREQESRLDDIRKAAAFRQEQEAKRVAELEQDEEKRRQLGEARRQDESRRQAEEEELAERLRLAEVEKADRKRRGEEERRLIEEEAAAAEERRIESERLAEQQREEERLATAKREEERRVAEETRKEEERLEAERRAEEQRVEEERRMGEARAAAERKRKEEMLMGFRTSKQNGEMMLSGWITVQTVKSIVWRRRWFNLHSNEIKLFKAEADAKPIQVVPLGSNTRVSQKYEESQVQGSFKVIDQAGEEWFMFTDGTEEKELVLAALGIAAE